MFTGSVSSPSAPTGVTVPGSSIPGSNVPGSTPAGAPVWPPSGSAATAYWPGWPEIRADLRSSGLLFSALGLLGLPAGVLWWLLAPRLDFRITGTGPVPVVPVPPDELLVADDWPVRRAGAVLGLLCGAAVWRLQRVGGVCDRRHSRARHADRRRSGLADRRAARYRSDRGAARARRWPGDHGAAPGVAAGARARSVRRSPGLPRLVLFDPRTTTSAAARPALPGSEPVSSPSSV